MKVLYTFALSFVYFLMHGQVIYHADTAQFINPFLDEVRNEIEIQKNLLVAFADSPKTRERLEREYSHVAKEVNRFDCKKCNPRKFYSKRKLSRADSLLVLSEISQRKERLLASHYNIILVRYEDGKIMVGNTEDTSRQYYMGAYGLLENGYLVDALTEELPQFPVLFLGPDPGEIVIKSLFYNSLGDEFLGTPIHEFGHLITDGDNFLYDETVKILSCIVKQDTSHKPRIKNLRTGTTHSYFDDPTEVKARLDALRYYMYRAGYYDAREEDFKRKHFRMLIKDDNMMWASNVQDLMFEILKKKKHLIWMLNNIA